LSFVHKNAGKLYIRLSLIHIMKTDTSTETNEELVEAIGRAGFGKFQSYLVERRERELKESDGEHISSKPSVDLLLHYVINGLYTCAHDVLNRFEYPGEMISYLANVRQASLSRMAV